jgi:hypothetical protein
MSDIAGVVRLLKKEQDRLTQRTSRDQRCTCGFRQRIWKGSRHQKAVRISSGTDRGGSKSALGKGSGNGEGYSYSWQTDTLGSRAKEDGRCTKGTMGESEGRKENGLAGH